MNKLSKTSGDQYNHSPDTKECQCIHGKIDEKGICGLHCIRIKDFGVKAGGEVILEHVNLHIHCGQLTSVIGKNGTGKTTLLRAILGEISHVGTLEFKNMKENTMVDLKIGYVPQNLNIAKNSPTSVYDLFASFITNIPVFLLKNKKVYATVRRQLERFEGGDLIDKAVCDLSGGELQRVLLSIATWGEPNLLILDEPVSGIDRNGMDLFYKNINFLKKHYDMAIILVSHDLEYVARYSDYVVLLDKTIIEEGKPDRVFRSKAFRDTFGTIPYIEES